MEIRQRHIDRFHQRYTPVPECGCWLRDGAVNSRGYGSIKLARHGKVVSAHRLSYEIHNGPVPDGKVVMHKCDIKTCVNPAHLQAGTQKENIQDAIKKGIWGRWK